MCKKKLLLILIWFYFNFLCDLVQFGLFRCVFKALNNSGSKGHVSRI